jgi:hypothetical protein
MEFEFDIECVRMRKLCCVCVKTVNCCNNKTINDMLVIRFGALINWVEGKKVASFQDGHWEEYN